VKVPPEEDASFQRLYGQKFELRIIVGESGPVDQSRRPRPADDQGADVSRDLVDEPRLDEGPV